MNRRPPRISLIDEIVNKIKAQIMSGEYAHDDLLPSQDQLSAALGVSRASLREALNQLSLMGLIEMKHGVGTFIRRATPSDFLSKFSSLVVIDRNSAEELLQTRAILEPAVTAMAAENATGQEIENIRQALELMESEFRTGFIEDYRAKDGRFHLLIAAASHNRILYQVNEAIRELLPPAINLAFAASQELITSAMDYHRRIYGAIVDRDPEAARALSLEHLLTVKRLHEQVFANAQQKP